MRLADRRADRFCADRAHQDLGNATAGENVLTPRAAALRISLAARRAVRARSRGRRGRGAPRVSLPEMALP